MTFDLLSVFIIISITQGLFVLFMLWRMDSPSKYASVLLASVILCFIWYQVEFLFIRNKIEFDFYLAYGTRFGSWLLLGPLLWLYLHSFFDQKFKIESRLWIHFLPFLFLTVIIPITSDELLTWRSVDYGMLTVFDNWNEDPITIPQYIYGSIFFFQFLHTLTYILIGLRFLNSFEGRLKNQYSNFDQINILWHRRFLVVSIFIILFISTFILFQFVTQEYRRAADYFYVIPMTGATYLLLFHAIKYPNLIFKHALPAPADKYQKSSLAPSVSQEYVRQLKSLIEDQQLFLRRELRLKDLADELDISIHYLSQSINENLNQNFFELINHYRIEAAKSEITKASKKSILQVAFEVGFNNKASFNNAFKKHVGMTPSRYKESA